MTANYRLYLFSGLSGRFEPAQEFVARDDPEAVAAVDKMRSQRVAELWSENRLVREWKS